MSRLDPEAVEEGGVNNCRVGRCFWGIAWNDPASC